MAGLFLCALHFLGGYLNSILGVNLGFLGFQLSSIWDSILNPFASILAPPGIPSRIPLLPAELHLGFYLGSLGFDLGVPTLRQRQEPAQLRMLRDSPRAMPLLGLPAPQHGPSKRNL